MPQQEISSDVLVRVSHFSLWIALATVLYVGSVTLTMMLGGPEVAEMARTALLLLPVANVIALGVLRKKAGKAQCMRSPAMRAVLNDELRQQALAKAYRNGFVAAMVATVAIAPVLTIADVAKAPAVMMMAAVTVGVATMLGSVLYHDR